MGKIFVAISHFHSALVDSNGPNGDDYSIDANATFVVIQPFLLTEKCHQDDILPIDYFTHWNVDRLKQTDFVLINGEVANKLGNRLVPVPLPPGCNLELRLEGETKSGSPFCWHDTRTIGGMTPNGQEIKEFDQLGRNAALGWPAFAVLSQAIPLVENYEDLDAKSENGPQKRSVESAIFALFSQMIEAWGSGKTPTLPKGDIRIEIWEKHVSAYKDKPLSDTKFWRGHLNEKYEGSNRIGWIYQQLITAVKNGSVGSNKGDDIPISVPRYAWDAKDLAKHSELFFAKEDITHTGRSYLDAMWENLKEIGSREKEKEKLIGILQRLFGFGERLAWPICRANAKRFMTLGPFLRPDAKFRSDQQLPDWIDPTQWFVTNMISLLGLVFRITPFDPKDPPKLKTAKLDIAGKSIVPDTTDPDLAAALNTYFDAIAYDVINNSSPNVKLAIAGEKGKQNSCPQIPERLVLFAAREAPLKALDSSAQPEQCNYMAVSEALLDLVDPAARFNTGEQGKLPTGGSSPRRGLFKCELASSLPDGTTKWQRRLAEIVEHQLTGTEEKKENSPPPPPPKAYKLRFLEPLHNDEEMVNYWLTNIAKGSARKAYLWIPTVVGQNAPQPVQQVLLNASNLRINFDDSLLILDPDPDAETSLYKKLEKRPGLPSGKKDPKVTIVLESLNDDEPFDLLKVKGDALDKASIILKKAPASRLGLTTDRLALALAATWSPGYDPDYGPKEGKATPLEDLVANTNKLRLALKTPDGFTHVLTDPDSLLPLPSFSPSNGNHASSNQENKITDRPWHRRGEVNRVDGPQAYYWLGEYWDQSGGGDIRLEEIRFRTWVGAGGKFMLSGYFEHQYGHRIGFDDLLLDKPASNSDSPHDKPCTDMRRAIDIVNPAQVHFGAQTNITRNGRTTPEGQRLSLIDVIVECNKLKVRLRTDAAEQALKRCKNGNEQGDIAADLRTYYRALAELRDAIHNDSAHIVIESWVFDNTNAIGAGKGVTLVQGLTCIGSEDKKIAPPPLNDPLAQMFMAFDQGFEVFRCTLESVVIAAIKDNKDFLAELGEADINKRASVLRIGLLIERPASVRASPEWAKGAMIPVATDDTAAASEELANVAQKDLQGYLENSRLTQALDWIFVPESEKHAPVLGSGASTFLVPEAQTEPVQRVVDLFFMPHAFVLPAAHPALGDRQSSFEFAGFLLTLIEDVLNGHPIDDRVKFDSSPLCASDAVSLRNELYQLLDKENGIADQIMNMFHRVDISEPREAEPKVMRKLHWHAGNLLDTLEKLDDLKEHPRNAVRAMVVERPTLYATARAIAILPFNMHVERLPDHAPQFNQDCFSSELLSLDLKKKLIGDDGDEVSDTTRFDLSALRGGKKGDKTYAYLIDVLPDRIYDDTVIIDQNSYEDIDQTDENQWGIPRNINQIEPYTGDGKSGVIVRRGEDVIDEPESTEPRSIAANVVHVFPSWRVTRRIGGRQAYYLLPERRMPPLARVVAVKNPFNDQFDTSQRPITLDLPEPDSTEEPKLPVVSLCKAWSPAYKTAIEGLDVVQITDLESARRRTYKSIQSADNKNVPEPPVAIVSGEKAGGWHLLTTVLANFYFSIDLEKFASKGQEGTKLVDQLDDDLYEIEIEMWRPSPPPDFRAPTIPSEPVDDQLLLAFRRMRARAIDVNPSEKIAIGKNDFVDSLRKWFGDKPYCGKPLLATEVSASDSNNPIQRMRFRIGRSRSQIEECWQIKKFISDEKNRYYRSEDITGELGSVVGFEILAQVADLNAPEPRYDDPVCDSHRSAIIRVSVLDHPFHVTRARLRILRNWIDIDGDDQPDIDPKFVLTSGYSEWACEGRTPQRVDADLLRRRSIPDEGREIRVERTRMNEWIDNIDKREHFDTGTSLSKMIIEPVFIDEKDPDNPQSLWEFNWMTHKDFKVSATIFRTLPDLNARYGKDVDFHRIPTREVTAVRQICDAVYANELGKLFSNLQPAEIMTLHPWTRITWRDAEGHSILDVDVPIMFKNSE